MTSDESHITGWDYEWCAFDEVGSIGVFTTAGRGPVPDWLYANRIEMEKFLTQLEARSNTGGYVVATHELFDRYPGGTGRAYVGTAHSPIPDTPEATLGLDDWKRWARLGLYAFDWIDVHRADNQVGMYELIMAPEIPLHRDATHDPPTFAVLPGIAFQRQHWVRVP